MGAKRIKQKTSRIDARETRSKFMKGILANDPEWAQLVTEELAKEGGGLVRQPGETLLEFWARANKMTPQEAEVQMWRHCRRRQL